MKNSRLYLVLFALFGLSALAVNAAQLASAKVLSVNGLVHFYAEGKADAPLTVGTILTQGDSISTTALSDAKLVFSNGSELTVEENTSVTIAELTQDAFGGNKSYEQLKADPSKSQALLELNYGKVSGHVKQLRSGSQFDIETPLGTAAIRGTKFKVELRYNAERGEFLLFVHNNDGKVNIISRYAGKFEYGRGNVGDKGYNSGASKETVEPIPAAHIVVIRLSDRDPEYHNLIGPQNYAPHGQSPDPISNPPGPIVTAEDKKTTIISDELPDED